MKRILAIICVIFTTSCEKQIFPNRAEGTLLDKTGLGGCSWVIEVEDEGGRRMLEPLNLDDFDISLVDSLEVKIRYKMTAFGSICQVGPVVKIKGIKEI